MYRQDMNARGVKGCSRSMGPIKRTLPLGACCPSPAGSVLSESLSGFWNGGASTQPFGWPLISRPQTPDPRLTPPDVPWLLGTGRSMIRCRDPTTRQPRARSNACVIQVLRDHAVGAVMISKLNHGRLQDLINAELAGVIATPCQADGNGRSRCEVRAGRRTSGQPASADGRVAALAALASIMPMMAWREPPTPRTAAFSTSPEGQALSTFLPPDLPACSCLDCRRLRRSSGSMAWGVAIDIGSELCLAP